MYLYNQTNLFTWAMELCLEVRVEKQGDGEMAWPVKSLSKSVSFIPSTDVKKCWAWQWIPTILALGRRRQDDLWGFLASQLSWIGELDKDMTTHMCSQ